jgi:PAS domain S-box-containing protein
MAQKTFEKVSNGNHLFRPGLLITILIAGILATWLIASFIENGMRNDLLIQAQLVAGAVNIERIKTLTGTEADLTSPDYLRRKEMLATVRAANPKCRFVYLIGRRMEGTVFFFADSEPAGSEDESPPGQIYDDIPREFLKVFETNEGSVEGPATDRWGTWVTALAPIINPETGSIVAVLCMDIDAQHWRRKVATRTALPVSLIIMVMGLAFLFIILRQRTTNLRINEQKYRYLFEGAAGGIAIIRGDMIEFANPALAHIAGHPIEKITSMPFVKLIHPDDQMMVKERHRRRMQGETVETGYDFRVIAADGSQKWVNISSQLIHWEGAPANLSFITDITDRKQAEEKLAAMYQETIRMNRLMRGREDRMLELKKEVNKLLLQLNQEIKYKSAEDQA